MRFKFKGMSDENFTNGNIYELVTLTITERYYVAIFLNDRNRLIETPYSSLQSFNKNWEYLKIKD